MGAQRTSFSKLQRDRDKKAKAAAKRERRQERSAAAGAAEDTDAMEPMVDDGGELSAEELLKAIESIHQRYEAKAITYEEFEEQKVDLLSRLPVD